MNPTYAQTLFRSPLQVLAALLIFSSSAWATPQIAVSLEAAKEIVEVKNGVATIQTVPATAAVSGDTIVYTITYTNKGNEAAVNAVINNPVQAGMSYIDNSVSGKGAEASFSIDGGKTYKSPSLLTYEASLPGGVTEKLTARPEEYTHIRWTVRSVAPGASGTVGFKARIK